MDTGPPSNVGEPRRVAAAVLGDHFGSYTQLYEVVAPWNQCCMMHKRILQMGYYSNVWLSPPVQSLMRVADDIVEVVVVELGGAASSSLSLPVLGSGHLIFIGGRKNWRKKSLLPIFCKKKFVS